MSVKVAGGSITLGRIAGADVILKPSLFIAGLLLMLAFSPQFSRASSDNALMLAAIFVVAVYVTNFGHELAHLIAIRLFGMRATSITMNVIGGRTAVSGEYKSPLVLLVSAIVGPAFSLLLGIGLLAMVAQFDSPGVRTLLWTTGWINVLLGLFNALPGMPLDGGQVIRALGWMFSGREWLGLGLAGWTGLLTPIPLLVWGLWPSTLGDDLAFVRILLMVAIAAVMFQGAIGAIRDSRVLRRVDGLVASELADEQTEAPEGSPRIALALRGRLLLTAMAENPADIYQLVDADGHNAGRLDAMRVDERYRRRS